jgi:AcrR family transcriptional regulator
MPRLWDQTIQAHRASVHDAILDTTAALVSEHGLLAVTMSQIAEQTGIGRATLYKYFSDVEVILRAWHARQINTHLEYLSAIRDGLTDPGERLHAVLDAFALLSHEFHGHEDADLSAFMHRDENVGHAHHELHGMIRDLLIKGAEAGAVRDDVAAEELAIFCHHALSAARDMRSKAAVRRLVEVTFAGLQPAEGRARRSIASEESESQPDSVGHLKSRHHAVGGDTGPRHADRPAGSSR